jgi:hypothetical protein
MLQLFAGVAARSVLVAMNKLYGHKIHDLIQRQRSFPQSNNWNYGTERFVISMIMVFIFYLKIY